MNKIILITGATCGIGKATAELFASKDFNLIITGRRGAKINELAKEIHKKYNVEVLPLIFDIRNRLEVENNLENIPEKWKKINVLVNNAGLALGMEPINRGYIDDWETMIDTNVKGLLYVSKIISNLMISNGFGHIVNIGSIAGKETYANGNVYCASKYAVDSLSKAMRIDLLGYGIRVTQICPGAINTEFSQVRFKGDIERANHVYDGYTPLLAENIADAIFYVTNLPEHVNINEMIIMPTAQANTAYINKK